MSKTATIERTAWISPCGRYRHALGRHWERQLGYALFIGLNPSTADADKDDPTIRRCIRFAREWGYGGVEMCNLFDWRATDPKKLPRQEFAVSDKNDPTLRVRMSESQIIIAAWGNVPFAVKRIRQVLSDYDQRAGWIGDPRIHCLGKTKDGFPRHPLYVKASQRPELYY